MNRYDATFLDRQGRGEGVFVPFLMLGDPDLAQSARLLRAAIEAGADMLELGIPFSDPIADGPTIQAAARRALGAGATFERCLGIIAEVRKEHASIPIGILTYANIAIARGREAFYAALASAGVDSALLADVPTLEIEPFASAARSHGVCPILIAPPDASEATLARVAKLGAGYTYCLARAGVTGADESLQLDHGGLFSALQKYNAPPPLLGFGISRPEHVRAALSAGARGAISGSAVVQQVTAHLGDPDAMERAVSSFVRSMKEATRA